jgi:hypothetical protein
LGELTAKNSAAKSTFTGVSLVLSVGLFAAMTSCSERPNTKSHPSSPASSGDNDVDTAKLQIPSHPSAELVAKSFAFSGDLTAKTFDPTEAGYDRIGDGVWVCSYNSSDNRFKGTTIALFKVP